VARIVRLVTSPRLPAGLLTAAAWDLVRAYPVFAGADSDLTVALRGAGVDVTILAGDLGVALVDAAGREGTVVWLGELADEPLPRPVEVDSVHGSWDPPGARLLDVVAVMDRLASPGGDPWKRAQTHQTLARYLLEEAYEAYDAIEDHDLDALREELGDVLLQVVLHARMAEEATAPWSIDDVARGLTDKLVRRNPHVFADVEVAGLDEITDNWERIKAAEKQRSSILDGIAASQPALALAAKVVQRAGAALPAPADAAVPASPDEEALGVLLFALVARAVRRGQDPEAALRRETRRVAAAIRAAEG
jgi:XTP/dITP diphosphohydrolase